MHDDPWTRRKTMKILAVADMCLAVFLIGYAMVRLLQYDYKDQSIVYLMSREESVMISVLYWIINFGLLSLQLVIAFLLLTATMDMTTDPETMMKKCIWWRMLSFLFFLMLSVDLFVVIYEHIANDLNLKIFRAILDCFEIVFRGYGVIYVGTFISDLKKLFEAPMVQYGDGGVPIPPSPVPSPRIKSHRFLP